MALQISLSAEDSGFGIACPEAYARITDYFGNKNVVQYQVTVWADQAAREAERVPVRQDAFYVETANLPGDIMPALYANLKTIAPYDTGVDV